MTSGTGLLIGVLTCLMLGMGSAFRHKLPTSINTEGLNKSIFPNFNGALHAAFAQMKQRPLVISFAPSGAVSLRLASGLNDSNDLPNGDSKKAIHSLAVSPALFSDGSTNATATRLYPVARFASKSVVTAPLGPEIRPNVGPKLIYIVK